MEAVGSGFVEAAEPTGGEGTTTDSLGCEDTKEDVPLVAVLEAGADETSKEDRAAAKLLLVCRAVMMTKTRQDGKSRTTKRFAARNKQHLTQQKRTTCAIRESPVCHLDAHDSQTTADQHWLDFNLA